MKILQAIMTFATDGEPITPRLVMQYDADGVFKQIVIEKGSDLSNENKLEIYFDLIEKFSLNKDLVASLSDTKPNETIQFTNPSNEAHQAAPDEIIQ